MAKKYGVKSLYETFLVDGHSTESPWRDDAV